MNGTLACPHIQSRLVSYPNWTKRITKTELRVSSRLVAEVSKYIDRGRDSTSIEMSSYNDTLILESHTTRIWSLCLFLARAVFCILNFLVPRVSASSALFKVESCLATKHPSFVQHHSQSLPFVDTLGFFHALNRRSQNLNSEATMKWVICSLALTICMQNVQALPQGSINSNSSDVSNSLPTATLPINTAFNSSVSSIQSTTTNALPGTTGVSEFLCPGCSHHIFCKAKSLSATQAPNSLTSL